MGFFSVAAIAGAALLQKRFDPVGLARFRSTLAINVYRKDWCLSRNKTMFFQNVISHREIQDEGFDPLTCCRPVVLDPVMPGAVSYLAVITIFRQFFIGGQFFLKKNIYKQCYVGYDLLETKNSFALRNSKKLVGRGMVR